MWVCGVVWVGWDRGVMALTQAFACSASFYRTINQHLGTLEFESFRPADDEVYRKTCAGARPAGSVLILLVSGTFSRRDGTPLPRREETPPRPFVLLSAFHY